MCLCRISIFIVSIAEHSHIFGVLPMRYIGEHLSSRTFGQMRVVQVDTSSWQSHPERQSFPRFEIEKARVTSAIKRSAGPCVACVYHVKASHCHWYCLGSYPYTEPNCPLLAAIHPF